MIKYSIETSDEICFGGWNSYRVDRPGEDKKKSKKKSFSIS